MQDFEVDLAFETQLLRAPRLRRFALWFERVLMHRFDRVSTISRNMLARLVDKGVPEARCILFANWVDARAICPLPGPNALRREFGIPDDAVVCLYSGNMGEKQGLETVIEAAGRLRNEPAIRFVLCGDGVSRKRLMATAGDADNVTWLPLQPAARLNALLNLADIHVLPQRADVADLVLPSKLSGMLASGRPVIATAHPGTQIAEVVAQCGIVVPPGDAETLAAAIAGMAVDRMERERLGHSAREYAVRNFDYSAILTNFEQSLLTCCAASP